MVVDPRIHYHVTSNTLIDPLICWHCQQHNPHIYNPIIGNVIMDICLLGRPEADSLGGSGGGRSLSRAKWQNYILWCACGVKSDLISGTVTNSCVWPWDHFMLFIWMLTSTCVLPGKVNSFQQQLDFHVLLLDTVFFFTRSNQIWEACYLRRLWHMKPFLSPGYIILYNVLSPGAVPPQIFPSSQSLASLININLLKDC